MLYSPLFQKLSSMLFGAPDLLAYASRREHLGTATKKDCSPAIYFKDELNKIAAVAPYRNLDWELGRILGGVRDYPTTIAYTIDRVVVLQGNIYKSKSKYRIGGRTTKMFSRIPDETQAGGVLVSSMLGAHFFGDWLSIDIPLARIARKVGNAISVDIGRPVSTHQVEYRKIFNAPTGIMFSGPCVLDTLTVLDINGITSEQIIEWHKMRELVRARHGENKHTGVYIVRGRTGTSRVLTNEDEVISLMESYGLRIIYPLETTAEEIAKRAINSKLVVGVEGSHLSHGFHCLAPGGTMLTIQPPGRFDNPQKDRCDAFDLRYAFTVGTPDGEGFRVELRRLEELLRLIDS